MSNKILFAELMNTNNDSLNSPSKLLLTCRCTNGSTDSIEWSSTKYLNDYKTIKMGAITQVYVINVRDSLFQSSCS